jgi:hypothetical protein
MVPHLCGNSFRIRKFFLYYLLLSGLLIKYIFDHLMWTRLIKEIKKVNALATALWTNYKLRKERKETLLIGP